MREREFFSQWWPENTEEWRAFCTRAWPELPDVAKRSAFLRNANPDPRFGLRRDLAAEAGAWDAFYASLRVPRVARSSANAVSAVPSKNADDHE